MASLREYVELVDHLIELTQMKNLKWTREQAPSVLITNHNRIKQVYVTFYNNRNLRIYEEMYKYYTDEDEYYWQTRVSLEFTDGINTLWQFPQTSNSWDLLNVIQYSDVDVDGFMRDVLRRQ